MISIRDTLRKLNANSEMWTAIAAGRMELQNNTKIQG